MPVCIAVRLSFAWRDFVYTQVFDGDMAYLHQTGVIAKNQDPSLDGWARDYFLASEADRCLAILGSLPCLLHICSFHLVLLGDKL